MRLYLFSGLFLWACAGSDSSPDSSAPDSSAPDSSVLSDSEIGSDAEDSRVTPPSGPECEATHLFIVSVDPGVSIELLNPTAEAVDIAAETYQFCQFPQYAPITDQVVIEPGARHAFAWPEAFRDTDDRGEVGLYVRPGFDNPDNMLDFVCWGEIKTFTRLGEARSAERWPQMEGCAAEITGEALVRIGGTDGIGAASYDPTGAADGVVCPR